MTRRGLFTYQIVFCHNPNFLVYYIEIVIIRIATKISSRRNFNQFGQIPNLTSGDGNPKTLAVVLVVAFLLELELSTSLVSGCLCKFRILRV